MRTASIGCALVLVFELLVPAAVRAQRIDPLDPCQLQAPPVRRGGWLLDVTYRPQGTPPRSGNTLKQMTLAVHYVPEGDEVLVFFIGGASITDGTSNTFLIGESLPSLTCDDTNEDGFAGIVRMDFVLRDVRTGELVQASIVPDDGELDHEERDKVIIIIGNLTVVGTVRTRYWVFGTELPH